MKKVLLTALSLGAALLANAQGIKKEAPGYAFDNFSTVSEFGLTGGLGIYFWRDTLNNAMPYIQDKVEYTDGVYKVEKTRLGDGKLSYTVSQPYGRYEPFGVGFGEGQSIDLSGGGYLKAKVGFKFDLSTLPTQGIRVKMALKDAGDKLIDSKGTNAGTGDQYKDELFFTVSKNGVYAANGTAAAGAITIVKDVVDPSVSYVTFNFEDGYYANYSTISTAACPVFLPATTGFDASKVTSLQITVVHGFQISTDCYQPRELGGVKFDMTSLVIGDIANAIEDSKLSTSNISLSPVPANGGFVSFKSNGQNVTVENVRIMDVIGNVVYSAPSASQINVDQFKKGLYVVQTSKGTSRLVVE